MALHVLGFETAEPNMDEVRQAFKKRAIEVPNGACKKRKGSATMTFTGVPAHQQIKRHQNRLDVAVGEGRLLQGKSRLNRGNEPLK